MGIPMPNQGGGQGGGDKRLSGWCRKFDLEKGFGFITREDGEGDLFVHLKCCVANTPQEGDKVTFETEWDPKAGKERAIQVKGGTGPPPEQAGQRGANFVAPPEPTVKDGTPYEGQDWMRQIAQYCAWKHHGTADGKNRN
eukprot:gnl/MRDRNA2_/MRDRNA2_101853_c0_seq1.p1 gnl/MRDRNA2_/MRDRNA2_101853_c0~~gnl/MRDRNA2_/MRDRNA2_101853_c0_seq1.p1  ORF type:complete len:157 (-),score=36.78 gnl/MRDRNA2_/MRDRNA2_101853_c0_seq1:16-435(-)